MDQLFATALFGLGMFVIVVGGRIIDQARVGSDAFGGLLVLLTGVGLLFWSMAVGLG